MLIIVVVVEYYFFLIIIIVGDRTLRLRYFSLILYHVFNGRVRNPPFYLAKPGLAQTGSLLLYSGFCFKNGPTAWDVSTFLEKTSSETSTHENYITTSQQFGVFFLFGAFLGCLGWPRCV